MTAVDATGARLKPTKDVEGFCPLCGDPLIAKIGRCRVPRPHWAHHARPSCDPWMVSDGESDWHRWWKEVVTPERREVVIDVEGERHFADILGNGHTVVEIQKSPIGGAKIIERAQFYNNYDPKSRLVWVFNAEDFAERLMFRRHPTHDGRVVFRWERPRDSHRVASNNAQVFWDFGHAFMFKPNSFKAQMVKWEFKDGTSRYSGYDGYGEVWNRYDFVRIYLGNVVDKPEVLRRLQGRRPPMPEHPFQKLWLKARELDEARAKLRAICQ